MKRKVGSWLGLLALVVGLAGCGCPGSAPEETVTPEVKAISLQEQVRAVEGGTITSTDGRVSLEIPAGALPEDTEVSINEVSEDEWTEAIKDLEPEGPVLRLEPDGVEFSEPVTVTLQVDPSEFAGTESEDGIPAYALISVNKDGEQEYVDDTETHVHSDGSITVSGKLSHFSWIVRSKSWLLVKLEKEEEEREVDETFGVVVLLANKSYDAPSKLQKMISAVTTLQTSSNLEIEARFVHVFLRPPSSKRQDSHQGSFLMDDSFGWHLKGVEPGTGVYTLIVEAEEYRWTHGGQPTGEINKYRVVLDARVDIVKSIYRVTESSGIYMETYATQEEVAAFLWKFQNKAGNPPSTTKFVCITPTRLPDRFREKYDSGEAIVERESLDKKADNLYIPFDEEGQISFSLRTQIPGEYAFEICGILLEDYTDDESYEGDGDEIVVEVPEPSEVSGLYRKCEEVLIGGLSDGYKCFICEWHLFTDESEIVSWGEIGDLPYAELTAPDGSKYGGLFLIVERRRMVEGHPWVLGQYEGTAEHHRYVTFKYGCSHFGGHLGECGYGEDGVLYFTVCLQPWETATLSIGDVAEDWFTYSGTGDPIVITCRSEDEPVTITYPD